MSLQSDYKSYSSPAKILHWLSALIVLGLLCLGFYMTGLEASPFKFDLYWWHKSFGTLLFMLVLARLGWRFYCPPPAPLEHHAKWEKILAKIVHVLLYAGMIGMPLSGLLLSMASDFPRPFFGLFTVPDLIPGEPNRALAHKFGEVHEITAWALIVGVGLHGAGAFKHHILDRDITLLRMLPDLAPRIGSAVALGAFIVLLGGAFLLGISEEEPERPAVAVTASADTSVVKEVAQSVPENESDLPRWVIVMDSSRITFEGTVQGAALSGSFKDFSGDIFFDPDRLDQSRADMRVKTASVDTGSDERNEYIGMAPWLFAESFPESRLVTREIVKIDDNQYLAKSDLTIRDVTLPVEVPFTLTISDSPGGVKTAVMEGVFTIDRLDFGIGTGEWSDPQTVSNAFTVKVFLTARLPGVGRQPD